MQTPLRDSPVFCWNVALILLLTLTTALAVTPLWSPAFTVVCYLAGVWSACFVYVILTTRSSRTGLDRATPPDQMGADFMEEAA
ncbi:MAG TPA: hypothetical protein VGJ20_02545 [Xanthobacteraceae bacterium]